MTELVFILDRSGDVYKRQPQNRSFPICKTNSIS